MQLDTVRAVITGGASGLGLATARKLIAAGCQVTLLDIDQTQGEEWASDLGCSFLRCDVSKEPEVREALAQATRQMGALNLAVACAGILGAGRAVGREGPMPSDRFAKVLTVNLLGTFHLAKEAAALMQSNEPDAGGERGLIVQTASVAAFEGQIGQAAYSASKGGVAGMTLPLAREFARIGVRVLTIAPGIFRTPMMEAAPAELVDALEAMIPFPSRLGKDSEFADLVAHAVENSYLNGTTIRLDGAVRMQPK